jgi:hypothetical protein
MKKISLIAGMASLATLAVLWTLPAAAESACGSSACANVAHDKFPGHSNHEDSNKNGDDDSDDNGDPTGVPEPGTLALMALGLGAVGAYSLVRRKRVKA